MGKCEKCKTSEVTETCKDCKFTGRYWNGIPVFEGIEEAILQDYEGNKIEVEEVIYGTTRGFNKEWTDSIWRIGD